MLLVFVAACDLRESTPPVQNVSYVTNVYTQSQATVETVNPGEPAIVIGSQQTPGIPACDAFFAATEACARDVTSDPAALAQFEGQAQVARSEALRAEASGDPGQIAHAASACSVAAAAYRTAPCGG